MGDFENGTTTGGHHHLMLYFYTDFQAKKQWPNQRRWDDAKQVQLPFPEIAMGEWNGDTISEFEEIPPSSDKVGVMRIRIDDIEKMNSNWLCVFKQWAIQKLQRSRAVLVLVAGHESLDWRLVADKLHHDLASHDIPQNNVVIWQASVNMNDIYTSIYPEGGLHIIDEWGDCARYLIQYSKVPPSPDVGMTYEPRGKHFLCMMREDKHHRVELLEWVLRNNLHHFFHISCGPINPELALEFPLAAQHVPLILDTQDWEQGDGYFIAIRGEKYYQDSYINITCESHVNGPIFFSEKIWKPILNHQPFIVVGQPGFLVQLHKLGFQTWSPWIDESYDDIPDPTVRQALIFHEISRLVQLSLEQLQQMRRDMSLRLIHNRQHFFTIDHTQALRKLTDIVDSHEKHLLHNHQ